MNLSNFAISLIRTWVPVVVGTVASYLLVHFGLTVDAGTQAQAVALLTGALIAGYYAVVHVLEQKFPKLGWLLGNAVRPHYVTAKDSNMLLLHPGATVGEVQAPRPEL